MNDLEYFNKNFKDVMFNKTNRFGPPDEDGIFVFGKLDYFDYIHVIRSTYTYYGPNMLEDFRVRKYKLETILLNFLNNDWVINKEETRNMKLKKLGL